MLALSLLLLNLMGFALGQHDHEHTSSSTASIVASSSTSSTISAPTSYPSGFTPTELMSPGPNFPPDFFIAPPIGTKATAPGGKITFERFGPYFMFGGATVPGFGSVKHPCPDTGCFITAFEADLEYADGTVANINTGAWLHHMVMSASGTGRSDLVCPSMRSSSRAFAAGNERATTRVDVYRPYGIRVNKNDTLGFILELMNEATDLKLVYLTIKMEVTADPMYKEAKQIWLDSCGCCGSSVPAQTGAYQLKTPTWKSTVNGPMLIAGGHTHDGGEKVELYHNNKLICTTRFMYSMSPEYISAHTDHGDGEHAVMDHISNSGGCREVGDIKVGDELYAIAYYNATAHPQAMHDGKLHPVMGIANIWIGM